MKKPHYYFDMPKETYDFIVKRGILKESKKEKTILDLCLQGKSLKEIMAITGYSIRTISYRKEQIYRKIDKCLENKDGLKIFGNDDFKVIADYTDLYNVYLLTFPNNKVYVGITSQNEKNRWNSGICFFTISE